MSVMNIQPSIRPRDVKISIIFLICTLILIFLSILIFYLKTYRQKDFVEKTKVKNSTLVSSHFFREFWNWITSPLFHLVLLFNLKPNNITIVSLVIAIFSSLAFTFGHISTGGWLLVLSGTFDTLDGRVARYKKIDSKSGAFFDSVVDRYSDYFIFVGIITYFSIFDPSAGNEKGNSYLSLLAILSLLGAHLISYSKERGSSLGATDNEGIMQRADRMMTLGISAILDPLVYFLVTSLYEYAPNRYYGLAIGLGTIGVFANYAALTKIARIKKALEKLENQSSKN